MSNKERARRALDAMKELGFSKKEATPVLRSLLKLFDNSWGPIEDECYRALADAILDIRDRPQGPEHGSNCARMVALEEDRHQPSTSLVVHGGPSTSLVVHGGPCDLDSETEAPRMKRPRTNSIDISADHSIDSQLSPSSSATALKRARQMMDQDFQDAAFLREPKPEPDIDDAQNFHDVQVGIISYPFSTSSSGAADPLALHTPSQNQSEISGNKDRPIQYCRTRASSTSFVEPMDSMAKQPQNRESSFDHTAVMHNTKTGSADEYIQRAPCLHTVVASSTMGEVKMSIKCSIDPSKFRMPSLEAVFRVVEDKCLRSYKIIPPKFSIGSLMNDICQCVAQLGNDHTAEYNKQSDSSDNGRNSQKRSMANGAALMESIACMNREGEKYKSAEESLILQTSENGQANSTVAQHLALSHLRCTHGASDISKGEEKARISVVNEFGGEKCPPSFYYMQRNLVSKKAYATISAARICDKDGCADCSGNCLSAPIPCTCARETGGEFAYTPDGLVRTAFIDECVTVNLFPEKHHKFFCKPLERYRNEAPPEPSRGHLVRKFIKECWGKCGCDMQCGNRVVQRGIACNLQVFFTQEGKGWGLRTLDELPKGAFVCEYVGEVVTNKELCERTSQKAQKAMYTYPVDLDADWGSEGVLKDEEALCLDATLFGNVGRFINHRCYDANLVEIPVDVETPDHQYYHLALFTSKKVEAFEELTWDYGIDFHDDNHAGKAFQCLCGSRYCRGRKRQRNRGNAAAK
ncbi:Histone-lysine N-methyltransferase SUVR4 [Dichanthelium oligosanthes]|uniref:Histone-lysine N-methyltransferase SUVR4 n=1 Tax=Dichanthelium oligosanthes TaxID=888268 RepID=A0A1E5WB15_9POAL|nr:Histone-lysine N-methyltransferase SUVR4 [Dichanthelium oligosanthes]